MSDQTPTTSETKQNLPWFKKKAIVIPLGIVTFLVVLTATSSPDESTSTKEPSSTSTPDTTDAPAETAEAVEPEPVEPVETIGQSNARRSAESYIDSMAFSRQGLIDQLKYEEYSVADATYAVDAITVDWNEQAAKSAENYLSTSAFSRGDLIDQLIYEGFTEAQANYGVEAVGY
jgi:hypothetical protein